MLLLHYMIKTLCTLQSTVHEICWWMAQCRKGGLEGLGMLVTPLYPSPAGSKGAEVSGAPCRGAAEVLRMRAALLCPAGK